MVTAKPSPVFRASSAESRASSPESRAPSAERRAPSTESRAPSAESRASSPESRAPSPEPRALHRREHRSVLAALERRVLIWMAIRLPPWTTSDHLTALGLVSMLMVGAGFAVFGYSRWAAVVVVVALVVNWFGDSLDGTLARVREQQRPRYGFYVDHVVDLAGATALFAGLAHSTLIEPSLAMWLLAGYLLVAAESFLGTHASGVFRLSFAGWGPTELRVLLAAGAIAALWRPAVSLGTLGTWRLFDVGGVVALAGFAIVFVFASLRQALTLYRAEPLPPRGGARA